MAGSAKRDAGDPKAGTSDATRTRSEQSSPALDRAVQAQIGDKLRALYGELADQPLPDRLTAILNRMGADTSPEKES